LFAVCAYVISSFMPGSISAVLLVRDALSVHLPAGSPTTAANRVS
jgi:hypothetical protein